MHKIYLLTAIFLCGIHIHAQKKDTLVIGKKLDGSSAVAETGKYILYYDMPDGKYRPVSLETRTVIPLQFNNQRLWAFIQRYQSEKAVSTDTTYFDEATLVPVAYRTDIASLGYKEVVDFEQASLKTKIIYADSATSNQKNITLNYLHAPMEDYIIERLPLKQDYSVVFKTINTGKNHFEFYTTITVVGSEEIVLPDQQKIDCWKVESNNGFSKSVLWFSKKSQEFIKRKFGTEARGIFWKIRLL